MTFNNWKELNIGGYDLKKLIRVSDGLVLFEKNVGPDYSEPFWVKGTYSGAGNHSEIIFVAKNDPTPLGLEYSTDKNNWTPLEFWYNTRYNEWHTSERFSTREVNKIYFRSGSETPVNPGDFTLRTRSYSGTPAYRPFIIGGNLNSFICKDFKDIVDLSEMLSCFEEFFTYAAFADANKLLLPAKSIGEYGYRRLFGNTNTLSATQKMSFDVEEIGDSGMRAAFDGSAFKGHLAFTSLKSVGPYGMHVIGNGSRLSSIEFPDNQISVDTYGMTDLAKDDTNLKHVNHINVQVLSTYAL